MHRVLLDELGKAGLIDWSRVSLSPDGPGFMDAWEFLSLSRMLDEWRIWKGLLDGGDLAGAKSEPEEGVADDSDDWWNPKWVPLTYRSP